MPLPARRRRKKGPDEAERATSFTAEVMAPTRMKLRRRDAAPPAASPAGGAAPEADADRSRESRRSSRRKNGSKASAVPPAAAASSPPSTSSGAARPAVAAEASPDSKCPICLDRFNNLAYLDHCLHRFCFPCIQEWSHNKAECPLCKQPFASILHSVRAEDDFKEYTLRPPPPPPRAANQLTASTFLTTVAAMTAGGAQHHLRLMLRRHLVAADRDGGRRRRERRAADGVGQWEFFMHSPPLPVSPYHLDVSELIMDNMRVEEVAEEMMRRDEERRRRRQQHQALGEEPAGRRDAVPPRASRRLMCRLAVRRRLQREGGAVQMREREVAAFRRALYRSGIRVRGVSGDPGRPRSVTADAFRRGCGHLNRLSGWLRRELAVLLGPQAALSDAALRTVTARVLRSGLEDAAALEDDLRPFLSAQTEHFVHELLSFARSSLSMETYDQLAVYEPPAAAAAELEPLSSPSDGSSVIAISEEEEGAAGAEAGSHDDVIQTGSSLSLSGWDDETPGPSYTSAEPPPPPANPEEAAPRGEEDECLIVGYKKPIAERTPELVQLSSDSEEDEGEKKKKDEQEVEVGSTAADKTPPPPAPSLPTIPPSTSGAFRAAQQKEAESRRRSGSWSDSSGWSRKSVCSLSPGRRRRDRKQQGDRRRKKKKKKQQRGRDRSREPHGKSGTFCNPNRSILPPMMSRCSPPPFDSSADSASSSSPPPPSPPDSGWALRLSQVSPLTSSVSSSPSRCLSPLCSSPGTPPSPPSSPKRPHHAEKPGGKRKYKSRHLNSSRDATWRPSRGRRRDRERKKRLRREAEGRDSSLKTGSRRSRDDRSPSVEIIYEGTIDSAAAPPSALTRRRRRHRRAQVTSSPVIITLDSDSSHDDDGGQKKPNSGSSSPLSSQQTIDFSDLPLAPCAGGGGAVEVGELPADILDRGSDGSEAEAAARPGAARRGDVEDVEDAASLPETPDRQQPGRADDTSDRYLLEAILDDLNRIAPPRQNPAQDGTGQSRERTPQEARGPASPSGRQQNPDPVPPPLERMEGREVPPLLRRASPVGSYHRDTPPPLKHKDAGSPPGAAAAGPPHVGPHRPSDPNPTGRNSPGLNPLAVPPVSTIQNQLRSASPRLPARSGSDRLPSLRFGSFLSIESFHSSSDSLKLNLPLTPATSSHSPDLHPAHRRNPVSPTRRVGAGGLGPSGWDFFSGPNSHGAAASRPDRPPAGGVRPAGSGSASKALAPPPSLCFIQSEPSSQSESRSESIRLPESNSASQNRNSPNSKGQNQEQHTEQPGPHSHDPAHHLQDPAHHIQDPAHRLHDPAHHIQHPAHRLHDPAHHIQDPAHRLHDPAHHIQHPAHRLHDPAHHIQDPAHRLHDPAHHIQDPAHRLHDPAHHIQDPAHQLQDPAHRLHDPAHHLQDPAHRLHDPAHHLQDPIQLSDSPPNFSFDSAHRQSSGPSGPAHLLFDSAHRQSSSRFSDSAHLHSGPAHISSCSSQLPFDSAHR